jgi:tRNA-splicing ligase RtcB
MEKLNGRLLNWASILDPQTKEQAVTTSSMPFIYPHLALMPDAHLGKGATVGSVIPTLGAIIPAAVGVDFGCGMIAVPSRSCCRIAVSPTCRASRFSAENSAR